MTKSKPKKPKAVSTLEVGQTCDLIFSHNAIMKMLKERKVAERVSI